MSTDYRACAKQVFKQTNQITRERASWMQRILFLSATLFGILIALHSGTQANLCIRLCFAVACVSLALGILLLSISSYSHIAVQTLTRNKYAEEVRNAIDRSCEVNGVIVDKIKLFSICEVSAFILLVLSVLLLAAYSLLLVVL